MNTTLPQAEAITSGDGHHWFGYYDKQQVDPSGRFALGMKTSFEGRSPLPDDEIELGVIDMADNNRWTRIGSTFSWCWQQGCMLQWIPRTERKVIWNERHGNQFLARTYDLDTEENVLLDHPIYTLSGDGTYAISTDFRRVNDMRPGYGYCGIPDPNADCLIPEDSGIWRHNLATGRTELIISIAQAAAFDYPHKDLSTAKHYFNHLLCNPDGSSFVFLHRWRMTPDSEFETRMFAADADGSNLRVVDDSGNSSHFFWKDRNHILIFTKPVDHEFRFYLYNTDNGTFELELDDPHNGHCVYVPGTDVILNDTYPLGPDRLQHLYLYQKSTNRRIELGQFLSPREYQGEWRCNLHPRTSPCGNFAVFDSVHEGKGRRIYRIDIHDAMAAYR